MHVKNRPHAVAQLHKLTQTHTHTYIYNKFRLITSTIQVTEPKKRRGGGDEGENVVINQRQRLLLLHSNDA